MHEKVVSVRVPEPDPEATKKLFDSLAGKPQWEMFNTEGFRKGEQPPVIPPNDDLPTSEGGDEPEGEQMPLPVPEIDLTQLQIMNMPQWSGVLCDTCHNEMVRTGSCYTCPGCGTTTGCG